MSRYLVHEKIKTIEDLMALHDERFITALYRRLLGREPDAIGHAGHLRNLRQGRAKLAVVRDIVRSDEGKSKVIELSGLDSAIKRYEDRTGSLLVRWRFRNSVDYGQSKRARDARAQMNQVSGFEDRLSTQLDAMGQALDGLTDAVRNGTLPHAGGAGHAVTDQAGTIHSIRSRGLNGRSCDLPGKENQAIARLKI